MTQPEILEAIKKLSPAERVAIIEASLELIRTDLSVQPQRPADKTMEAAARAMQEEYTRDKELTAFTALDHEPFHA